MAYGDPFADKERTTPTISFDSLKWIPEKGDPCIDYTGAFVVIDRITGDMVTYRVWNSRTILQADLISFTERWHRANAIEIAKAKLKNV